MDLSSQHACLYDEAGNCVWQSDIVSGKPSTPTPCGVYKINQKNSPTTLIGAPTASGEPEYRTVVQY